MVNQLLLWFMALPILIGGVLWYSRRQNRDAWILAVANVVIGSIVLAIAFYGSQSAATADVEIWNGQITAKERLHGTYEKPYECRCKSVESCTGSGKNRSCSSTRKCDTCYETRYTVNWNCTSTIGGWTIDSRDSTFRSVYSEPDPQRWSIINPGDPVSKRSSYTNYIQAVPETLFKPSSESLKAKFSALIPAYPDQVYDVYRLNRFLTPGYSTPDAAAWNNDISMMLRELGPRKQVNTIVVIAKTDDPNYEYALRDAWEGANKNDVVLIIGSKTWPQIDFVRVISWTKAELFKVELRDRVQELGTIQRAPIMSALQSQITKNFERRRMREFKYLESEIDPPSWLLITVTIVLLLGGALSYAVDTGFFDRFTRRRSRF